MGALGVLLGWFKSWRLIAGLAAIIALLGGALYVVSLRAQNERLRASTAALEDTIAERDSEIARLADDKADYESRVRAVMGELAKYEAGIVGNALAAEGDYRGITAPSADVRVLERQANEGYAKIFRELNALSR